MYHQEYIVSLDTTYSVVTILVCLKKSGNCHLSQPLATTKINLTQMHAYMYWYGDVPMEYVNFEIS